MPAIEPPPVAGEPASESAELYRSLFEEFLQVIVVVAADGRILVANRRAEELFGAAEGGLIGRRVRDLFSSECVAGAEEARRVALRQGGISFSSRLATLGGDAFPAEVEARRFEVGGRPLLHLVVRDVAGRRLLQEQLRQAQKMEAIGRLAGGIAHDFNNLLTGIIGYADMALDESGLEEGARDHVEEIRRAGLRAASLTRQLLAYSRRQVLHPGVVSLNDVVADLEPMLRRIIGEDIALEADLHPELAAVLADRHQLEQVLLNLAVNARDAMPRGGRLVVSTRHAEVDAAEAVRRPGFRPGSYVTLEVEDTGEGMDRVTLDRIFEPFFTTKPQGKGSGLGLSMVYGIVKQSGGWIYADSAPGKGATFRIYLPRAPEGAVPEPEEAAEPAATAVAGGGGETILVVEDEAAVLGLVRKVLEARGHRVLEAGDGAAAERMMAEHADAVDLVLTDVVIPGLSGRQLVDRLRADRPDLPVLFMTGYTDEAVTDRGLDAADHEVLQKPFTADALMARIRRLLDG